MIFFFSILSVSLSQIYPKTATPILLSRNNANSIADYTFSYQISAYIPSDAIFEIHFPETSYPSGLGVIFCAATNWNNIPLNCSISMYTVSLNIGELSNANSNNTYTLTIHNVPNPGIGGSGMFRIQIRTGINILDYSDFFAEIGIVPALSPITLASVTCNSNCIAGLSSQYSITYTTTVAYQIGSRIFIRFPSTLTFPSPVLCTSSQITGITCTQVNNLVSIVLTSTGINAMTAITIVFGNVVNPAVSGNIGKFDITVFAPFVNTVLEEVLAIAGPSLLVNAITSIVSCPGGPSSFCIGYYPYVALNNTQPYTLTITTTNPVPRGGLIFIQFLQNFKLVPNYCLVTSGLTNQGYTEDDQILCVVDPVLQTLTVTKFGNFSGGVFKVAVIASNPSVSGTYSSFKVTTYTDLLKANAIDTGSLGYITVVNIHHPQTWQVSFNLPLIVNSVVQPYIIFQPYTNNLDSSTVSFKIYFPSTFAFVGAVIGYLTPHDVFPELQVTPQISGTYIQIPSSTVAQPYTNSQNAENRVRIAGASASTGLLLPSMPGNYFVEMVLVNNGVDIESIVCEFAVLPDVMPGSITAFGYDVNKNSLYEVSFTPTITIPQGTVPELPQYSWGTFDIRFPTMNSNLQDLWLTDLGTGLGYLDTVPCKGIKNIAPVVGDNLICRLLNTSTVATNTYASVRVTNFQIIYQNVPVTLHLANITNIQTSMIYAAVDIATYQITQRMYQELNEVNFTFPYMFKLNPNPSLPKINGRSPSPNGDGTNEIVFLPNIVNTQSMVTFILWMESDIQIGGNFYLKFPSNYPLTQASISCYINYASQLACYTYPDCGWISILNLNSVMKNHVEYTFTIRYLTNPRHQVQPAGASLVAISNNYEIEYVYFSNFAYLTPGAISPVNVYPSSYKALAVDTTYFWIFTLTNDLASGSSIVLSFPSGDYVLNISPSPTCSISGLEALNSLSTVSCIISGTSIIISSFSNYQGGSQISVNVNKVLNPATARLTGYFQIETYDETNSLVDANYVIAKITIQAQLKVTQLVYIDFYANPSNGFAVADYTISVLPTVFVPAQSLIVMIFPQDSFAGFSVNQTCTITGGLSTLDSCYSDGANTITVVTDSDYQLNSLSSPINITVYALQNFAPMLTSGLLEVDIYNSGVLINSSPDTQDNRKVSMTAAAGLMTLQSVTFDPVTATERAVYNFTLIPTTAFQSSCSVVINFPINFPRSLSEMVYCYSEEISKNPDFSVLCVVNERELTVYDTVGWNSSISKNFTISVQHVRNPSVLTSGYFIYYSQCGYSMIDFGQHSFSTNFNQVPSIMSLTNAYSKGNTVLFEQEYVKLSAYNYYSFSGVYSDQVFVDFPIDYDLRFVGAEITCEFIVNTVVTEDTCLYEPNRVRVSAFNSGNNTSLYTNYTVALQNIENPAVTEPARYISLGLYQQSTSKVLAKTYSNLNIVSPFSYISQGIPVVINSNQQFNINIGTSIDSVPAYIASGAQTFFSILGDISEKNCESASNPINFNIRDFTRYFSVSCNSSAIVGAHYISWSFLGSWPTNFWSPIKRTYFSVVGTNSDLIQVADIGSVSLGGQSLPILVTLTNSPESDLTVNLQQIGSLPTNITIFPKSLTFVRGIKTLSFTLTVGPSCIGLTGKVHVTKSGTDSTYFTLASSILTFDVGAKDTVVPVIVEYKTLAVSRITASFSITVTKACNIYYMVARYGTRSPSISEAISGSLNNVQGLFDSPIFGKDFDYTEIQSNRFQYTLQVQGLIAQTNYTIFMFAVDIGGNPALYVPELSFTTVDRYRIATFPMYFNTSQSDFAIQSALNTVANILGISTSNVIQRTDYSGSTGSAPVNIPYETNDYVSSSGISRLLDSLFKIDVLVLPIPSQNIRPLDLINSLNNYQAELANITDFNTSYTIIGQEIYGILPVFKSTPLLGSAIGGVLTVIDLSLFDNGFISLCLYVYNESNYANPIPYQVNNQLDPHNYKCNMSQIITATPIPTQAFFQGIKKNIEYRVFVSGYNTIQTYPDYMDYVQIISFTTIGMGDSNAVSWGYTFKMYCLEFLFFLVI